VPGPSVVRWFSSALQLASSHSLGLRWLQWPPSSGDLIRWPVRLSRPGVRRLTWPNIYVCEDQRKKQKETTHIRGVVVIEEMVKNRKKPEKVAARKDFGPRNEEHDQKWAFTFSSFFSFNSPTHTPLLVPFLPYFYLFELFLRLRCFFPQRRHERRRLQRAPVVQVAELAQVGSALLVLDSQGSTSFIKGRSGGFVDLALYNTKGVRACVWQARKMNSEIMLQRDVHLSTKSNKNKTDPITNVCFGSCLHFYGLVIYVQFVNLTTSVLFFFGVDEQESPPRSTNSLSLVPSILRFPRSLSALRHPTEHESWRERCPLICSHVWAQTPVVFERWRINEEKGVGK